MGKVAAMVSTHDSRLMPLATMVEMIVEVSVDKMLAFTPLPRPSAKTTTWLSSLWSMTSTWSPQSCSPNLLTLIKPMSVQRSFIFERLLQIGQSNFGFRRGLA